MAWIAGSYEGAERSRRCSVHMTPGGMPACTQPRCAASSSRPVPGLHGTGLGRRPAGSLDWLAQYSIPATGAVPGQRRPGQRQTPVRPHRLRAGTTSAHSGYLLHRLDDGHRPADRWVIERNGDSEANPPTGYHAQRQVACPSGLRSTPRKRVWVRAHRGFKSHRYRTGVLTKLEARK